MTEEEESQGKYIVVTGDPIFGYEYTGPFDTEDEAIEWAGDNHSDPYWWTIELDTPEYYEPHTEVIEGEVVEITEPLEEPKAVTIPIKVA